MLFLRPKPKQNPPIFVTHPVFRAAAWGNNHPLAIPRQTAMLDLCETLGWLTKQNTRSYDIPNQQTITRFHDPQYVDAFYQADRLGKVSQQVRKQYKLGTMENPLFPGLFERASATIGGSIRAAELALQGRLVFHPSGGTHHGRADRASGFCYFNDPVFAALTLLDGGCERIAYVDIDAHHGDGVQDAFTNDSRVLCMSIHEKNRWPYSGKADDMGNGYARNYPVAKGIGDAGYNRLLQDKLLPELVKFAPDAVLVTCGADALEADPLSAMCLSNLALINATVQLCDLAPVAVVLGGGGYNPWTTARLWTALWGVLSGQDIPAELPEPAQKMLATLDCDLIDEEDMKAEWTTTLLDTGLT